ncbi:MAG TPA: tRNA-specific adenosine deaminase, partial [Verrucomicrobiales bacterium]|nr:tRNA-specific adenosine deaminase [Verrucomicrobiales bacterium]
MGQALREARKAYAAEEVPIGAVVVREGKVIARGWNQVETLRDATAHAEMLALTA